jgi:hypothetical protein
MDVADRMQRRLFLAAVAALGSSLAACRTAPAISAAATASVHPRLLVDEAEWLSLAARRQADPDLDRFVDLLLRRARADLARPPLQRRLEGRRLLGVSREFIRMTLQWSFAWRVTGETVFLDRARGEMLAVAAYPDWNPSHFLDVAEMTAGMAIGYDWLFDGLSPGDRAVLRAAIVGKGIAQTRGGHVTFRYTNNWSQVCIGGMVLGALAIQEDEPDLARDVLAAARRYIAIGLDAYKPDGAYPEGPSYWTYGTTYSVLLIAALRTALGADWGVLDAPGFARSAEFYAHSIGPSGKHFNYADGSEGQELPSAIVYLARALGQPAYLEAKREMIRKNQGLSERFAPLSALWWPARAETQAPSSSFVGQGPQPVAIWRSAWGDANTLWFGVKGGGAAHNHAHMDAGSFVLDMDGVRWAKDLGMQDYNSLESRGVALWDMKQGSGRWKVFRLSSEAHNTLTIDGRPHNVAARAGLQMSGAREAVIDLSQVLGVGRAQRRIRFLGDAVEIEDRIEGAAAGRVVRWAMCTEAAVGLDGRVALLTQQGKRLRMQFAGGDMHLQVLDISAPRADIDAPNPNTRQVIASSPVAADGTWSMSVRLAR